MAEQNRQITIENTVRAKESSVKGMSEFNITLSDGSIINAFVPEYYDASTFVDKAQKECIITYQSSSISHNEALFYARKAIKKELLG